MVTIGSPVPSESDFGHSFIVKVANKSQYKEHAYVRLRNLASFGYIGVTAPLFSKIVGFLIWTLANSIVTVTSRGLDLGASATSSLFSMETRIAVPAVPAAARVFPVRFRSGDPVITRGPAFFSVSGTTTDMK